MNIALLGYGKMGHAIEDVARQRGHSVVVTIDNEDEWLSRAEALRRADLAIEFSQPDMAVANIRRCLEMGLPVVVGTTGWYDHLDAMRILCQERGGTLFVASNFSIGMNIMFDLNRRLAQLMNRYSYYDVSLSETHHIHKLDAPSGTAITLANDMIERLDRKKGWTLTNDHPSPSPDQVPVTSFREGEVPGIHEVVYDSEVDTIRLSHSAKSRQGLAVGAVLAAEFAQGKKGFLTMQDLLAE